MKKAIFKVLFLTIFVLIVVGNTKANTERDSLLNLLDKHKQEDTIRINLLLDIIYTYWNADKLALQYINEAISLSEKLSYTKGIVVSKYWLTNYLRDIRKPDSNIYIANEILELSKDKNYAEGTCYAYMCLLEYNFWDGNYEAAIDYYGKIRSIYKASNENHIIIKAKIIVAMAYARIGNKIKAESCLNNADIFGIESKRKSLRAYVLSYKTYAYSWWTKDYKKFKENYASLLKILTDLNDLKSLANMYRTVGGQEYWFGNYSKYLENTYRAFEIYRKLEDKDGIAQSTETLCWIYYLLKDYEKSKYYGQFSLKLCRESDIKLSVANNLCNIGLIQIEKDSLEKAEDYFSESLAKSFEIDSRFLICWNYIGLAVVADKKKQFDKAFKYYH